MAKFTCPYCYGEHTLKECGLKCSYTIPGLDVKCRHGVSKDEWDFIGNADKARCMRCTDARKRIYCPTIKKEVPSGFLAGSSLPIALVGAKASGKSNYIAVLIEEIRKKMTSSFNCTLDISCSEESKRYYDDYYYKPLYRDSRVVEGTDAAIEVPPLIFPLRFMDGRNRIKKVSTLTFYDTAGENFDSDENVLVFNRYIPNAKGIILLLDPLQVPAIRRQLEGKGIALPAINTDVAEILSRIIQNIRDVKNIRGTIKIPLALAFTKMDALEAFDIVPPGSCLRDESEHLENGAFVRADFENTNIEMSAILENWLDEELVQMMKHFEKYSIFGLSALGGIPQGNKLAAKEIHPKRVLDPLLWILAENKFIPTIK